MKRFAELTKAETAIELLRWAGVLPAAAIGYFAGRAMYGVLLVMGLGGVPREGAGRWVHHLVAGLLANGLLLIAAAKVAPRWRHCTAVVLAAAAVGLAARTHWLIHRDYLPVVAEAVGVLFGLAFVLASPRSARAASEPP